MRQHQIVLPLLMISIEAALFGSLTWYLRHRGISLLQATVDGQDNPILLVLLIAWWGVGGRLAVSLARYLLSSRSFGHGARIVTDLIAAAIYLATILAIIRFAFGLPVGGLLATSGIIAIVLGLALQSTLADVFSGIAVGIERPYKLGDIISAEGGVEGTVVQVNWRSTHIVTDHDSIVVIPNSIIAKSRLENRSAPTTVRRDNLVLILDHQVDPRHSLAALGAAVRASHIPLLEPEPSRNVSMISRHTPSRV